MLSSHAYTHTYTSSTAMYNPVYVSPDILDETDAPEKDNDNNGIIANPGALDSD